MDPFVALLLAVAILAAAVERWHTARAIAAERETWRIERAELLTRIQRPELVLPLPRRPTPPGNTDENGESKPAAYAKVGMVRPIRDDTES
jgi:hypothetical protein